MKKQMILVAAGQSNAVGFDESPIPEDYFQRFRNDRISQLGFLEEDNLKCVPLGPCAQNFQDLRPYGNPQTPGCGTRGIHLPLADRLLDVIPEDYDMLVLPCAYGGVGFTVGEDGPYDAVNMKPAPGRQRWGAGTGYDRAMKDRLRFALDLNPENRFLAMVWCQGEQDSGNAAGHRAAFDNMTEDFFDTFRREYPGRVWKGDWNRSVWYNLETTFYWYGVGQCAEIWRHYREWCPETYIEVPRDTPTNAVNGTGLTTATLNAHFGNGSYENIIAPLAAAKIAERLK